MDTMQEVKFLLKYKMKPAKIRDLLLQLWIEKRLKENKDVEKMWKFEKAKYMKYFYSFFGIEKLNYKPTTETFKKLEELYNILLTFF